MLVLILVCICLSIQTTYVVICSKGNKSGSKHKKSGARIAVVLIFISAFLYVPTMVFSKKRNNLPGWSQYAETLSRNSFAVLKVFVYAGVRKVNKTVYLYFLKHSPNHWKNVNIILKRRPTNKVAQDVGQKTDKILSESVEIESDSSISETDEYCSIEK